MPGKSALLFRVQAFSLTYAEQQLTFSGKLGTVYLPLVQQCGGHEHRPCSQVQGPHTNQRTRYWEPSWGEVLYTQLTRLRATTQVNCADMKS